MRTRPHAIPRPVWAIALSALAALSFGVFRALDLGAGAAAAPAPPAPFVPIGEYVERSPHVRSSLNIVGIQGAVAGQPATPPPEQPPLAPSSFARPVARYLAYAGGQLASVQSDVATLRRALAAGDRAAAESAWRDAFAHYLRLGAVYLEGPLAALDRRIDGGPGGLAGGDASPRFVGLHRIELGLWTGAAPQTLVPYATGLAADVRAMRALLPHVAISPLDFATRAHEILEDAVRDMLSGADVPWSGEGVLGTAAALAATREVIATLRPLLVEPAALAADPPPNPRSPAVVDADLDRLAAVLASIAAAHGGRLPTDAQLRQVEAESLDAAVGQALEGLAQLPGMLETTLPAAVPTISAPAHGAAR